MDIDFAEHRSQQIAHKHSDSTPFLATIKNKKALEPTLQRRRENDQH